MPVYGDPSRLRELISRLAANAVKYSHIGSEVRVRVTTGLDGDASIAIEDDGIGIEEAHLQEIFTPGGSAVRGGTVGERGSGFGLAHARAIANEYGASIHVVSAPGRGSVFRVDLPRSIARAA